MESLLILLALTVLGLFITGSVAGWIALNQIGTLRRRIQHLERHMAPRMDAPRQAAETQPDLKPEKLDRATSHSDPVPVVATASGKVERPSPFAAQPKPAPRIRPKTPKPTLDLETVLGAKGSVWIGGIALLLGAVFLLRYTIEAGLLTPQMRVAMALLLGVLALGVSDWFARRDMKHPVAKAVSDKADIPALLAAIGVFSLFGAVYASHALYGLLGTLPAFAGMAAVALGAMGLSLRRGPWLAGIGLIGALAVPLLVASVTPSYLGVFGYVAVITVAALWVADRERWLWLRVAALAGATAWLTMLLGKASNPVEFGLWIVAIAIVSEMVLRDLSRHKPDKGNPIWTMLGWSGFALLTGLIMLAGDDFAPLSQALPFLWAAALILRRPKQAAEWMWPQWIIVGGQFALIYISFIMPGNPAIIWPYGVGLAALAGLYAVQSLNVAKVFAADSPATGFIGIMGAITAFFLIGGLDQVTRQDSEVDLWAGFALSGLFAVATMLHSRVALLRGAIWVSVALWLVSTIALDDLPVRFAVTAVGLALYIVLASRFDDLWVRSVAIAPALIAGLLALNAVQEADTYIGLSPGLNALWYYFGLPALISGAGAWWLLRKTDDLPAQVLRGGAFVFTLLLIVLLIHHAMNDGDLSAEPGFGDLSVQLLVAFVALFGSSWVRSDALIWPKDQPDLSRLILPGLAMAVSALSLGAFALFQLLAFNPLFNPDTVIDGHIIFNTLLLGYFVPAILLTLSALRFSGQRPAGFVRILGGLAGISWLMWTTAQIRRVAQGPRIDMQSVPWANGELYAVSAVWLLTGLALLLAGLKTGRRDLRLASAVLLLLTSLKVFLVDMSALDGALRAVSFLGLGITLIGIGRLYQRVLATPAPDVETG